MARIKKPHVLNLIDPEFNLVTLYPGDEIPDWAADRINNPDVIDDADAPSAPAAAPEPPAGNEPPVNSGDAGAVSTDTTDPPAGAPALGEPLTIEQLVEAHNIKSLRDLAKTLEVAQAGSKQAIAERIHAALVAQRETAAAVAPTTETVDGDDPDLTATDRASLEARAAELGLSDWDDLTDEELIALIDSEE